MMLHLADVTSNIMKWYPFNIIALGFLYDVKPKRFAKLLSLITMEFFLINLKSTLLTNNLDFDNVLSQCLHFATRYLKPV